MKTIKFFLYLTLTLSLTALTGCDSDDDDDPAPTGNGSMSATVEGNDWNANVAVQATYITQGGTNALTVVGSSDQGEGLSTTISLNLLNVTGTGTIAVDGSNLTNLSSASYAIANSTSANDAEVYNSVGNSGQVTITELTETRVSGTFTFVGSEATGGTGTRTITDGEFSVNF